MKLFRILMVASAAVIVMASCDKSKTSEKSNPKLKNATDSVSYCLGVMVGKSLQQYDMPAFNNALFSKTVNEIMKKKEPSMKQEEMMAFLNSYFMKLQTKQSEKTIEDGKAFLEKNKAKSGVITTASGLQYEVIKDGTGPSPIDGDDVIAHYTGTLINGEKFDSSIDRGQPADFNVNGVIPGWTEALKLMKVGSKFKVYIPSELGYGQNPPRGSIIKPNSVLIFEMELLSIKEKAPEKPAAKK